MFFMRENEIVNGQPVYGNSNIILMGEPILQYKNLDKEIYQTLIQKLQIDGYDNIRVNNDAFFDRLISEQQKRIKEMSARIRHRTIFKAKTENDRLKNNVELPLHSQDAIEFEQQIKHEYEKLSLLQEIKERKNSWLSSHFINSEFYDRLNRVCSKMRTDLNKRKPIFSNESKSNDSQEERPLSNKNDKQRARDISHNAAQSQLPVTANEREREEPSVVKRWKIFPYEPTSSSYIDYQINEMLKKELNGDKIDLIELDALIYTAQKFNIIEGVNLLKQIQKKERGGFTAKISYYLFSEKGENHLHKSIKKYFTPEEESKKNSSIRRKGSIEVVNYSPERHCYDHIQNIEPNENKRKKIFSNLKLNQEDTVIGKIHQLRQDNTSPPTFEEVDEAIKHLEKNIKEHPDSKKTHRYKTTSYFSSDSSSATLSEKEFKLRILKDHRDSYISYPRSFDVNLKKAMDMINEKRNHQPHEHNESLLYHEAAVKKINSKAASEESFFATPT